MRQEDIASGGLSIPKHRTPRSAWTNVAGTSSAGARVDLEPVRRILNRAASFAQVQSDKSRRVSTIPRARGGKNGSGIGLAGYRIAVQNQRPGMPLCEFLKRTRALRQF